MWKRVLKWIAIVVGVLLLGVGGFVVAQASAFDSSIAKKYDVPPPAVQASTNPAVIDRGEHLARSLGACTACHGEDLGGKVGEAMGPLGLLHGPNLTTGKGGVAKKYTDGQLARIVRHGIKADDTTLRFMPAQDFNWWPDSDLVAIVSYLRSLPPVDRSFDGGHVGTLGKVLDRLDFIILDVARRIDHTVKPPPVLAATPTAEYGANLGKLCQGCHGAGLSGGPIPGAPPELPVPANITPHETGIKAYTEADFVRLLNTGIKRDGKKVDPFMSVAPLAAMSDVEKQALWAYLKTVKPQPFGNR